GQELNARIRRELKPTNGSWRTDETYVRVAGGWTYLYRAVDSTGATIDFLLSETRDLSSARRFFQKALAAPGHPRPRVINVDGNPSYPTVIEELVVKGRYRGTITYRELHRLVSRFATALKQLDYKVGDRAVIYMRSPIHQSH